jgi:hypothetical protein
VWSDETYRIFEYSPRDKVTLDMIVERVHSEDRNFVLETVERASTKGGAIDYEYLGQRRRRARRDLPLHFASVSREITPPVEAA